MADLQFDEATHTYTVDGVVKPSVTQILEATGFIQASKYAPGAADFGTLLHKATQAIDSGVLTLEDYQDTDLYDKLSAYCRFLEVEKPEYHLREEAFYCEAYDYAGTVDIVGVIRKEQAVVDIKAGFRNPERWHGIQLALYTVGVAEATDARYNLYLGKGVYKLEPRTDLRDYPAGIGAVAIWHWRNHGT